VGHRGDDQRGAIAFPQRTSKSRRIPGAHVANMRRIAPTGEIPHFECG